MVAGNSSGGGKAKSSKRTTSQRQNPKPLLKIDISRRIFGADIEFHFDSSRSRAPAKLGGLLKTLRNLGWVAGVLSALGFAHPDYRPPPEPPVIVGNAPDLSNQFAQRGIDLRSRRSEWIG